MAINPMFRRDGNTISPFDQTSAEDSLVKRRSRTTVEVAADLSILRPNDAKHSLGSILRA